MAIKAVQLYLAQDVLSIAASTAQAANPLEWPTIADVPWYAYRGIGNMLVSSSVATSVLATRIVYELDTGSEQAKGDIELFPVDHSSVEYAATASFKSNQTGAETAVLDIKFSLQRGVSASFQRMENLVLRTRYLLDENWRKERPAPTNPNIPNLGDNTITNFVRCVWQRHPVALRADEAWERYILCYTRAVPKI